jgi:hypothetical protein
VTLLGYDALAFNGTPNDREGAGFRKRPKSQDTAFRQPEPATTPRAEPVPRHRQVIERVCPPPDTRRRSSNARVHYHVRTTSSVRRQIKPVDLVTANLRRYLQNAKKWRRAWHAHPRRGPRRAVATQPACPAGRGGGGGGGRGRPRVGTDASVGSVPMHAR